MNAAEPCPTKTRVAQKRRQVENPAGLGWIHAVGVTEALSDTSATAEQVDKEDEDP